MGAADGLMDFMGRMRRAQQLDPRNHHRFVLRLARDARRSGDKRARLFMDAYAAAILKQPLVLP